MRSICYYLNYNDGSSVVKIFHRTKKSALSQGDLSLSMAFQIKWAVWKTKFCKEKSVNLIKLNLNWKHLLHYWTHTIRCQEGSLFIYHAALIWIKDQWWAMEMRAKYTQIEFTLKTKNYSHQYTERKREIYIFITKLLRAQRD